ncbi:MAG: 50S ribosomal protein L28 [Tissierellia bacterium]|nr:50S ribosomal protein L28 [Tissierellia bacterium]
MSRTCEICGKSTSFGNKVTFSHRRLNRKFAPNVHKVRVVVDGTNKRMNVCSKCLKHGKVQRAN